MVKPKKVGLKNGKFYPCPPKHYCVSTQSDKDNELNYIEPIYYEGDKRDAMDKIVKIVNSMKRTKLLEKTNNYLHFQFTTGLLRFKDDVEFYFDDEENIIHFRSQSRVGGYDYGTNRKRMETIRAHYEKM